MGWDPRECRPRFTNSVVSSEPSSPGSSELADVSEDMEHSE